MPKRQRSEDNDESGEDEPIAVAHHVVGDEDEDQVEGELGSPQHGSQQDAAPVKRPRGRPKGSTNKAKKQKLDPNGTGVTDATPPVPKKRGRPPKPRSPEELAAQAAKAAMPKRPRGRPRKPRPLEDPAAEGIVKKRGRPKKTSSPSS
ncbi:hypothetical protein FRC03_004860 [Tulasnella sp. 419]|nr:hypothetical protein FRC02_001067 [Tulasnella sp. 418]KAG8961898.1 hypothetical protein FRC03_004860 [Tulasnella sp. 419]